MKLIIDIPEKLYATCINIGIKTDEQIAIANGTLLDDVKAEIKQKTWDTQEVDGEHDNYKVVDLSDVLQILDNIGKAESEIHCNCTDEEIAKSFIEDVEAVKDLLPRAESEGEE